MALLLASSSPTRANMLKAAGIAFSAVDPRLDEESLREALSAEGASPRDIADALASEKARKLSHRHPDMLVLGADQILSLDGVILGKSRDQAEAEKALHALSGRAHHLFSAAVLFSNGQPLWRHVDVATLTMHELSADYIRAYLDRHWPGISGSVGAYRIEEEGARLFSRIEGNHFTILGLPLLPLLDHLVRLGMIDR